MDKKRALIIGGVVLAALVFLWWYTKESFYPLNEDEQKQLDGSKWDEAYEQPSQPPNFMVVEPSKSQKSTNAVMTPEPASVEAVTTAPEMLLFEPQMTFAPEVPTFAPALYEEATFAPM